MSSEQQAFLDYYKAHNISPVAQDVSDLNKHFQRRNALYRQCGIPSVLIKGRDVLEVGPGTGHNALFTNSLAPKNYVLLDGNPKSCQETEKNLHEHFDDCSNINVVQSNFWDFETSSKFDLVCCEGTIPWQNDPEGFLLKLSSFVKPGGVLLITSSDETSCLSEVLRRLIARIILSDNLPDENTHISQLETANVLDIVRPFFTQQLSHLKGMSRNVDDWVHDNILQPLFGKPLSISQAINTLSENFDIYGSSPQTLTDWRWYKDIHGKDRNYNDRALEVFSSQIHNMLDYRAIYPEQKAEFGGEVVKVSSNIMSNILLLDNVAVDNYPSTLKTVVLTVTESLSTLACLTEQYSDETSLSIQELKQQLTCWSQGEKFNTQLLNFSPWFGRGQQYLSFTRRSWFEVTK